MSNNILYLTVGLPRSGKSTYAKSTGFPIVNPDSIRLAIHNTAFIPDAEPLVWVIAKYMVKALFIAGHTNVILDATNTTKDRRNEWKSKLWECKFIEMNTNKAECIQRAMNSNTEYLIPTIEKMSLTYETILND